MARKPIILTNAFRRPRATRFASGARLTTQPEQDEVYATVKDIIQVILELDATPLMLPTAANAHDLDTLLDVVDGILLPGAVSNIHPQNYGTDPADIPQVFAPDHDALDIQLVQAATSRGIPLLGICRGMQAMNVAFGGTLHQSISGIQTINHLCSIPGDGESKDPTELHGLQIHKSSPIADILPQGVLVNSIHEQAVDKVGAGLTVVATAPDGIVEAITPTGIGHFMLGVQWHPESQRDNAAARAVFGAFRSAVHG